MTRERPRPARLLVALFRFACARDVADAAIGDVLEELDARIAAGDAPRSPSAWLNAHVLRAAASTFAAGLPAALRAARYVIRDAARGLARSPAHALFILCILAVGISAATVTFSVVDAVVLRPLPYAHSERIVEIGATTPELPRTGLTVEQFQTIRDHVPGLEAIGISLVGLGYNVSIGDQAGASAGPGVTARTGVPNVAFAAKASGELGVGHVTLGYFKVLGFTPLVGRFWSPDEEAHADGANVSVISYDFWQRAFGGDPRVIGREIHVGNEPSRIIGVLPQGADEPNMPIAVWQPSDALARASRSGPFGLYALGRLRAGVNPAQVTAQIESALAPLAAAHPETFRNWRPRVQPWLDMLVGDARTWMLLLLGIVGLVVLIACVNAANVMLTRSAERAHELAIRASLGASRRRLATSLLCESLLLSIAASACALLFSTWGIGAIAHVLPPLFRSQEIALNGRVFTTSLAAAVATGLLFGAVPAWQASRASVTDMLKDAGTSTTGRRRWRSAFLVTEVACIGVLLVVSTLFIASFVRVTTLDLGFDRSHLLTVSTLHGYQGTVEDVQRHLAAIPGITGVAAVRNGMPPLVGMVYGGAWDETTIARVDGRAASKVETYRVTPNYFAVSGMTFQRGSTWTADDADAHPIVIDERAARALFRGQDPLGQPVVVDDIKDQTFRVVGVVPQAFERGPDVETATAYYAMPPNYTPSWVGFVLRTSAPPPSLVRAVEASLAQIAPPPRTSSGEGVHVVNDAFSQLTARRRLNAGLMSAFAVCAILIGAAGIYAVMASVVAQQTREIGVRVALGATPGNIRRDVLAAAMRHLALGLAIGLPIGGWISRGFTSLFFKVAPTDASIYVIVAVTLAGVGLMAAIIPARRAARVDPIVSLRAS
jgi:predicted permease